MFRFNPQNCAFYPHSLKSSYIEAGAWPDDGIDVEFETFKQFRLNLPPSGMTVGADVDGKPIWVPTPEAPTEDPMPIVR